MLLLDTMDIHDDIMRYVIKIKYLKTKHFQQISKIVRNVLLNYNKNDTTDFLRQETDKH